MFFKILSGAAVLASAMSVATPALAQAQTIETAVTFNIPVNLTQLSPDIERVRAACLIQSDALTLPPGMGGSPENLPGDETYVLLGKVETTFQVVFPIGTGWLKDPIGKTATYNCGLLGYSKALQGWQVFGPGQTGAFNLNPPPQVMQGTFTW